MWLRAYGSLQCGRVHGCLPGVHGWPGGFGVENVDSESLEVSRESSECQRVAQAVSKCAGFWGCLGPRCGGYRVEPIVVCHGPLWFGARHPFS